jgi:hypothetical protein
VTLRSAGKELGRRDPPAFRKHRTVTVKLGEPLRGGPPIRVVIDGRSMDHSGGEGDDYHFEYRLRRP